MTNFTPHKDIDLRDTWAKERVWIVKPRTDGPPESSTNAMGNTSLITRAMPQLVTELGANLVIVDTVTAIVSAVFKESVDSGKHVTGGSPKFNLIDSEGNLIHKLNTADRRDYGLAQKFARDYIRDGMLKDPRRNYHLIHVAHIAESRIPIGKDSKGEAIFQTKGFGPSVGGPAAVEAWGTDYSAVNRVFLDEKGRRHLQLQTMDVGGYPYWCRTNSGGKTPTTLPIPDTAKGCLEVWNEKLRLMGIKLGEPEKYGYLAETLMGAPMSGKTRWLSTLALHPEITGIVYVAADGNSEFLSSWWNEIKGLA